MKNPIKTILKAGFIAGLLDGIAAVFILAKMKFHTTFQFIASGIFGKSAFGNNEMMVIYGIFIHFMIAIAFAAFFFLIYKKLPLKNQPVIIGLFYGIFIWLVMNLCILPFSNIPPSPFTTISVIKGMAILMVCVGLPISLIVSKNYEAK